MKAPEFLTLLYNSTHASVMFFHCELNRQGHFQDFCWVRVFREKIGLQVWGPGGGVGAKASEAFHVINLTQTTLLVLWKNSLKKPDFELFTLFWSAYHLEQTLWQYKLASYCRFHTVARDLGDENVCSRKNICYGKEYSVHYPRKSLLEVVIFSGRCEGIWKV